MKQQGLNYNNFDELYEKYMGNSSHSRNALWILNRLIILDLKEFVTRQNPTDRSFLQNRSNLDKHDKQNAIFKCLSSYSLDDLKLIMNAIEANYDRDMLIKFIFSSERKQSIFNFASSDFEKLKYLVDISNRYNTEQRITDQKVHFCFFSPLQSHRLQRIEPEITELLLTEHSKTPGSLHKNFRYTNEKNYYLNDYLHIGSFTFGPFKDEILYCNPSELERLFNSKQLDTNEIIRFNDYEILNIVFNRKNSNLLEVMLNELRYHPELAEDLFAPHFAKDLFALKKHENNAI